LEPFQQNYWHYSNVEFGRTDHHETHSDVSHRLVVVFTADLIVARLHSTKLLSTKLLSTKLLSTKLFSTKLLSTKLLFTKLFSIKVPFFILLLDDRSKPYGDSFVVIDISI
jgi:hypothetical protein